MLCPGEGIIIPKKSGTTRSFTASLYEMTVFFIFGSKRYLIKITLSR